MWMKTAVYDHYESDSTNFIPIKKPTLIQNFYLV